MSDVTKHCVAAIQKVRSTGGELTLTQKEKHLEEREKGVGMGGQEN